MPRKPRLLPVHTIEVQGLSGGDIRSDHVPRVESTFLCDFDGDEKPLAPEVVEKAVRHAKRVRTREQMKQAAIAKHVLSIDEMMQRQRELADAFVKSKMQPTYRAPVQPGQQAIKLTEGLVMIMPAKPWRRF